MSELNIQCVEWPADYLLVEPDTYSSVQWAVRVCEDGTTTSVLLDLAGMRTLRDYIDSVLL